MSATLRYQHVIIGNSAAAVAAVEALRAAGDSEPIAMIGEEPYPAYARHLISYFLTGQRDLESMRFRPKQFYADFGVTAYLGVRAEQIDWARSTVLLSDGNALRYEKLLLATGARPVVPPLPGRELQGAHTFTTLSAAIALKATLPAAQRVAVIGGGLIGLQVAEALAALGKSVSVVELLPRLLTPVLDEPASKMVAERVRAHGVRLCLGVAAKALHPFAANRQHVGSVELANGEFIPADAVVMAVGVAPRTELALNSAVQIERGIIVDGTMATSIPNVYAAGDVAAGWEIVGGERRVVPVWPNAYRQGYTAGLAMAGRAEPDTGSLMMNAAHFFGLPVVSAGIFDPPADAGCETLSLGPDSNGHYRKLVLKQGRLAGFVAVGDAVDRAGILCGLIRSRTQLNAATAKRLLERCDLVALDREERQRRQAGKLVGRTEG